MNEIGKENIVIDLSCRLKMADIMLSPTTGKLFLKLVNSDLNEMSHYASEFLIHGVDVEGNKLGLINPSSNS